MKRISLALLLIVFSAAAHAAKFTVTWKNPSTNTDGTALTNLASIELEWGTCNNTDFGTRLDGALIASIGEEGADKSYVVTVTGQTKVCIRAFALTASGAKSTSSSVAVKTLLPTTGKPVTLDQPIILEFN